MTRIFKRASSLPLHSRSPSSFRRSNSEPRSLQANSQKTTPGKGIYTLSGISLKQDGLNVQLSSYLTIPDSPLPLEWTLPLAIRAAHSALVKKLEEKYPNRRQRFTDFKVDHPELCMGSKPFFIHVRPLTDLGSLLLAHLQRILISDRVISFHEPFRVSLIVSFFPN